MLRLRGLKTALRDFGGGAKIDENRVGLRSSETASRRFTPVFSKPELKNHFSKPLFLAKSVR